VKWPLITREQKLHSNLLVLLIRKYEIDGALYGRKCLLNCSVFESKTCSSVFGVRCIPWSYLHVSCLLLAPGFNFWASGRAIGRLLAIVWIVRNGARDGPKNWNESIECVWLQAARTLITAHTEGGKWKTLISILSNGLLFCTVISENF
jgi:hypothetical protein